MKGTAMLSTSTPVTQHINRNPSFPMVKHGFGTHSGPRAEVPGLLCSAAGQAGAAWPHQCLQLSLLLSPVPTTARREEGCTITGFQ